ncbi:Tetratricopeptide repeat [Phytophthora cactorum]|nr:Tetratricopeptide repeat [Phytophthora cactorum]
MGMALEQLFVRVSDAPEVSPNSESCVQQVARVCGLSAAARDDDAKLCTLSGFADTKQQLAVACMLHWQLQQTKESGATVSVSDSAMGTCFSLAELLNCDKTALETPDNDAAKVLDAAAFAQQVLQQQEEDHKVQILDCREQKDFLGLASGKEVSGHLEGARNVPFASIFTDAEEEKNEEEPSVDKSGEGAFLLPVEELREVFEGTALIWTGPLQLLPVPIAIQRRQRRVRSLPKSNEANSAEEDKKELKELEKAYSDELVERQARSEEILARKKRKKKWRRLCGLRRPPEVKTQCGSLFQDVIEVCSDLIYQEKELNEGAMAMSVHKWVEEKHDHECTAQVKAINELWEVLYTPPAVVEVPDLSEDHVFELATKLEQKMRELVGLRTPWAFDSVYEEETESSDEESEFDPQETVIDLEEEEFSEEELDEMDKTDEETILPRKEEATVEEKEVSVEKVDSEETTPKKEDIKEDISTSKTENVSDEDVGVKEATETATEEETSKNDAASVQERPGPVDKLAESWKHMYPSVVYALGFIPQDVNTNHKKLSTLQIKSFIQAVAEASWDVIKDETKELSQIEFQALCDTLHDEKREQLTDRVTEAEKSLYVLKHFLTRSLKTDDSLADKLASVREAVLDGDIRRRTGERDSWTGQVLSRLERLGRAKTEALIALKLNPYCVDAYECLGIVEEKTKHPETAMQHYVTSFILDGSRSAEHAESIDRASRLVGRHVAKNLFAKMEKKHELPSSWLVDSYFEAFEHDADYTARVPFDIAKKEDVEQSDLDALTLLHRAIHYKRIKNYGEAQRDIWTLVAKDMEAEGLTVEDRALALNLHASLLYVAGDVHTAVEVINKSLELQPTLVNSLVKKGGFLAEIGETDEATSCFSEAMELDSNEADVHLHLGQMELLDGNYYKAAQCLRRCISRSDALPVTHVSYGMALYKSGSTYQAKDVFEEASKKFPESAEVHLFYGEVLADQGNYADAMRHFLTAWELSPQCPLPFLNAGRVYVGTNDPMRAIAHFKQALEVDPRCSSAHLDIAQVLFAQGRTSEAFEHFEVAASCCRFLPEVEEVCACQEMAKMQLKVTEILGVELRHIMRSNLRSLLLVMAGGKHQAFTYATIVGLAGGAGYAFKRHIPSFVGGMALSVGFLGAGLLVLTDTITDHHFEHGTSLAMSSIIASIMAHRAVLTGLRTPALVATAGAMSAGYHVHQLSNPPASCATSLAPRPCLAATTKDQQGEQCVTAP